MNNRISVVLPVYNEETAIGNVIDELHLVLSTIGYNYEIIVVDDASTDRTKTIASEKKVRLLEHLHTKGSGAARKTGILHAQGDTIVMIDADGTYPVKSIPEALQYLPKYDQVIGIRSSEQGTARLLRWAIKGILFKLASYLVKRHIPDLNSGFRVIKKEVLLKYLVLIPNGFSCVSTMTLAFLLNNYKVKFFPIDYYPRKGKSKFRIFAGTKDLFYTIIRITLYFNPLRLFIPTGAFILCTGIGKTIIDAYFGHRHNIEGFNTVFLVTGILVMITGLFANLIVTHLKK